MAYVKLCCAAALAAVAQASVFVRDSAHLTASSDNGASLTEEDVSFLVARVAGAASPLESKPPAGLPVPDLFHKASGSVMLVVTGANVESVEGTTQMPMDDSSSTSRQALRSMLTGNTDRLTVDATLCASLDSNVAEFCAPDATIVSYDKKSQSFTVGEESLLLDQLFQDTAFFSAVGIDISSDAEATHTATSTSFDLTDAATIQFLAELQMLHQLPSFLENTSVPEFTLLSAVGPQVYTTAHSPSAAVDAVVEAATPLILDAWSQFYGNDAFEVAVVRQNVKNTANAGGRRVLSTSSASSAGYTIDQIAEYQIFTWTWFLGLLIIFFAACNLGGLDIGHDDAGLYSKFKAGSYDRHDHAE